MTEREKGLLLWGFAFLFLTLSFTCELLSQLLVKVTLKGEVKYRTAFVNRENKVLYSSVPVYFPLILIVRCLDIWRAIYVAKIFKFFSQWKFPQLTSSTSGRWTWNTQCVEHTLLNYNSAWKLCVCVLLPWSESQGISCNLVILN